MLFTDLISGLHGSSERDIIINLEMLQNC